VIALAEVGLMTTEDVSRATRIPAGTLRYFRSTGQGPMSFRLGGRIRYRHEDVMTWIEEQERNTRRGAGVA
jgi:DNA-binding transcriptional MerR regulator